MATIDENDVDLIRLWKLWHDVVVVAIICLVFVLCYCHRRPIHNLESGK